MSEAEMNAYRFNSGKEPTDEMLAQIMREVAEDAKKGNEDAANKYLEDMRQEMKADEAKWADRINKIKNGKH
ncbi:hypothetical protein [Duncaniella muris]|uniref:hypothetical protein n=1 Tax=Duncaniella muris TaxID=2094150 RepID=UPI0026F2B074|nr:hypothetical protein [Duncaniella muris]